MKKLLEKQAKPIKDQRDKQTDAVKKQKKERIAALNKVDVYAKNNLLF